MYFMYGIMCTVGSLQNISFVMCVPGSLQCVMYVLCSVGRWFLESGILIGKHQIFDSHSEISH
jgi:hypothetical protein